MSDSLTDLLPEIRRAAEATARNWADVISPDDLEQEITLALLEKQYADEVSEADPSARSVVLRRIGEQIASQYRTDYDHFTGQFFYGTKDVRAALEAGALSGVREQTNTERLDVDEGMALLRSRHSRYADVITLRYMLREPVEDRKLLTRAVDALAESMNRVHENRRGAYADGIGTRRVVSNAVARNSL